MSKTKEKKNKTDVYRIPIEEEISDALDRPKEGGKDTY
jgi:hypothetical protein